MSRSGRNCFISSFIRYRFYWLKWLKGSMKPGISFKNKNSQSCWLWNKNSKKRQRRKNPVNWHKSKKGIHNSWNLDSRSKRNRKEEGWRIWLKRKRKEDTCFKNSWREKLSYWRKKIDWLRSRMERVAKMDKMNRKINKCNRNKVV